MNTKTIVAVVIGIAATAVIVAAEVQTWNIGPAAAAMLGAIAGFVPGYLAPTPNNSRKRQVVYVKAVDSAAETVIQPVEEMPASESSEKLT
jgi:ABC-type uncharacterized transport system permease subunit